MRRVWIPAVAGSLVLTAGLIAISYDQRGATPAHAADVAGHAVAAEPETRAASAQRPAAEPPTDAFGGGWDAGYGAAREAAAAPQATETSRELAPASDPHADEAPAGDRAAEDASYAEQEPAPSAQEPPVMPPRTRPRQLPAGGALAQTPAREAPAAPRGKPVRAAAAEIDEEPAAPAEAEAEEGYAGAQPYSAEPAPAGGADAFSGSDYPAAPATGAPAELTERASPGAHRPLAAATPAAPSFDEGTGEPGARDLEGLQAPSVSIEKILPVEVQVDKETEFVIRVRNNGVIPVYNVELRDQAPKGARLIGTTPSASRGPQGELLWQFDSLEPNAEKLVKIALVPMVEGELGSVASVVFEGRASGRTKATQPALAIEVDGPKEVLIGEQVLLTMKLSNTGSGAATGVVLEESIPEQFTHPAGKELELDIGILKPGESRKVELKLTATKAGRVKNAPTLRADGDLKVAYDIDLEVLAPDLKVALEGPKKRFLETRATYTVSVSNPGTATAKNVELITYLPKGLKFVQANNAGQYDAAKHTVQWNLVELPASETGDVTLVAEPVEQGEQKLRVEGRAQQGLSDQVEETVLVEGLAAILFQVVDMNDPIEVGGDTTYEIRVTNQGSKAATNLQLVALLDNGMTFVNASGSSRHAAKGQSVEFEPLKALAPKAETTYKVRVRADAEGDLRLRVQVLTAEMRSPVTKEESTHAYGAE
ncbi:MAG: hypothetical protein U0836_19405 [Pirellulales bacterium]